MGRPVSGVADGEVEEGPPQGDGDLAKNPEDARKDLTRFRIAVDRGDLETVEMTPIWSATRAGGPARKPLGQQRFGGAGCDLGFSTVEPDTAQRGAEGVGDRILGGPALCQDLETSGSFRQSIPGPPLVARPRPELEDEECAELVDHDLGHRLNEIGDLRLQLLLGGAEQIRGLAVGEAVGPRIGSLDRAAVDAQEGQLAIDGDPAPHRQRTTKRWLSRNRALVVVSSRLEIDLGLRGVAAGPSFTAWSALRGHQERSIREPG